MVCSQCFFVLFLFGFFVVVGFFLMYWSNCHLNFVVVLVLIKSLGKAETKKNCYFRI